MRKEYTKITTAKYDENMQPTGETQENIIVSLWADEGKMIRDKRTGIQGTGVEFMQGGADSEDDYEEIDV